MKPGTPDQPGRRATLDTSSMVLGIIAIPTLFLCFFGLPIGAVAVVTGVFALVRQRRDRTVSPTRAIIGIVLGLIAIGGAIVLIVRPDK